MQKQVHKVDGSPYKGDECSPKWTDIKHNHKMEGSSYEGDDLKFERDRQNKSARRTNHPTRVTNIVPTGRIHKQVHKVDGSPYQGDEYSPKWTNIKHVHKIDEPSHEDDDWKSKMDESKISPQSGRITNSMKELSTK